MIHVHALTPSLGKEKVNGSHICQYVANLICGIAL